jgi:hypothetical protein
MSAPNIQAVKTWLLSLQANIVAAVEAVDGKEFIKDSWERPEGGGGISVVHHDQGNVHVNDHAGERKGIGGKGECLVEGEEVSLGLCFSGDLLQFGVYLDL